MYCTWVFYTEAKEAVVDRGWGGGGGGGGLKVPETVWQTWAALGRSEEEVRGRGVRGDGCQGTVARLRGGRLAVRRPAHLWTSRSRG